MKFKLALVLVGLLTTAVNAEEVCTCTEIENVYDFTTVDPNDVDYMEDFYWEVVSCTGHEVKVNLITEDNPLLDTYVPSEDGNELLLYGGKWVRFDEFKPQCGENQNS